MLPAPPALSKLMTYRSRQSACVDFTADDLACDSASSAWRACTDATCRAASTRLRLSGEEVELAP